MVTLTPRAPCPFLRAVAAPGKERLRDKIPELQEASEFLKKQPEAEGEVRCILHQEASGLSLENRVRSTDDWLLGGDVADVAEQGSVPPHRLSSEHLGPYLKDRWL